MNADVHLRSFIDRVLRCREAEDAAKEDTKAVYADLAAVGFEKAVVGQVVNYLRKREKDGPKFAEQSEKFDLYLDAYDRTAHMHAHERTHRIIDEFPPHDPETGELVEQSETVAATETAVDDLREPAAVVPGQIVREGDAPRETDRLGGDASRPDTEITHSSAAALTPADEQAGAGSPPRAAPAANSNPPAPTSSPAEADKADDANSSLASSATISPDPHLLAAADGRPVHVERVITCAGVDYTVLIDLEDEHLLNERAWEVVAERNTHYLYATQWDSIGRDRPYLHRAIMQPDDGYVVDHANRNGLDNRRANLRTATRQQNAANRVKGNFPNTSAFKGVYRRPEGRFVAQITVNNQNRHLGSFANEEDAASAYDKAAVEAFGEFAKTNFPVGDSRAVPADARPKPKLRPSRPNCLKPEACAGQGNRQCYSCEKAAAAKDVAFRACEPPKERIGA